MPRGRDIINPTLLRVLIIGESKSGKTHWVLKAAEAGYHIVYLNGDVAEQTLMRLDDRTGKPVFSDDAVNRVTLLNCGDGFDGESKFSPFLRTLLENKITFWDDTYNELRYTERDVPDESTVFSLIPNKFDSNVIVVVDTWTTFVYSLFREIAELNPNIDLSQADKLEWSLYQAASNRANNILHSMRSLPCHTAVLAHPDEQVRKSVIKNRMLKDIKDGERKIESVKLVPKSTSKAHSMNVGTYFSDVIWASINAMDAHVISGAKSEDRICGSCFTQTKPAEEYSFAKLVELSGGKLPDKSIQDTPGVKVYAPGAIKAATDASKSTAPAAPVDGNTKAAKPLTLNLKRK